MSSFEQTESGRWVLHAQEQELTIVKATSDDGATSKVRKSTKSTRDNTPPPRPIPVPTHLMVRLLAMFGDRIGTDDACLAVGPRGAVGNQDTFRDWWKVIVGEVFGGHPTLSGITPHAMRHAGMTYWFAAGVDHKRCQKWGGWTSLKEMLDTYRGVIDALESETLHDLDRFHTSWADDSRSNRSDRIAEIVDLASARTGVARAQYLG